MEIIQLQNVKKIDYMSISNQILDINKSDIDKFIIINNDYIDLEKVEQLDLLSFTKINITWKCTNGCTSSCTFMCSDNHA